MDRKEILKKVSEISPDNKKRNLHSSIDIYTADVIILFDRFSNGEITKEKFINGVNAIAQKEHVYLHTLFFGEDYADYIKPKNS